MLSYYYFEILHSINQKYYMKTQTIIALAILLLFPMIMFSQISAELIQFPDVSEDKICFTFGDDLWIVDKMGGDAQRLASPVGREINPKFSPDGKTIAYQANYDGNFDIYTLPILGGIPSRVTGHGMSENILDWSSDGMSIYYSSSSESGKQRWAQFYKINKAGGLPEKLPIELGAHASISADGNKIAFTDKSRIFRNWKRYRGGTAPDIHIMDMTSMTSKNITNNAANDELPMWYNNRVYYMSDNGAALRNNLWMYDPVADTQRQLTFFTDYDIHAPSMGPSEIVFEAGGKIQLLDLSNYKVTEVIINAVGDFSRLKSVKKNVSQNISNYNISPDGNRVIMEARGDIFSLPKKDGFVENITRTSGVAERYPAWSPDSKSVAYFTDKSGEYDLAIYNYKTKKEKIVSSLGEGFRYNIYWSPDSKFIVYVDQSMTFYIMNVGTGVATKIDQAIDLYEGGLRGFGVSWSADSRWVAYSRTIDTGNAAVFVYDIQSKKINKVTSGFYNDNEAVFDPEGKYLYVSTNRDFSPIYSDFDNTWIYPNATVIGAIPLRKDVTSPLAEKNDAVEIEEEKKEDDSDGKKKDKKKKKSKKDKDKSDDKDEDKDKVDPVKIDFDGIERRMVMLPIEGGNVGNLSAAKGKIIYMKYSNSGSESDDSTLKYYDIEEQEEKSIISDIYNYKLSADGEQILIRNSSGFSVIEVGADKKAEDKVPTEEMTSVINPREEWKQIFNDVWRLERDYFYDADMHGVDWNLMKEKYGVLIDQAMSRYDVNFILGELIGELNASHTYRGGGDSERAKRENVGYLGCDWTKENGGYKIKRIVKGADWDTEIRSPLEEPGVDVSEGDYILAVNGIPLVDYSDPWMAFAGMSGKTVQLTVNKSANMTGARHVLVKPISSETRLRNLEWIENNRQMVDSLSNGKIGYIYVPSTGGDGQKELVRMFYGQSNKEGLIIDERFNNGGQIPDRFIELLNRKPLAYFNVRDGKDWQWPPVAHFGPKAMLINGWSGSGGDAFPDYFRRSGLGPLIGTRTWGGVIGISGAPTLIDGGSVTLPSFRMYDPEGNWFAEGHGVEPDMEVPEDHASLAKGKDTQIEAAVDHILKELSKKSKIHPDKPMKEDRSK